MRKVSATTVAAAPLLAACWLTSSFGELTAVLDAGTGDASRDGTPDPQPMDAAPEADVQASTDAPLDADATGPDSGDAGSCSRPNILEPTPGEGVGPAIHLRVAAPLCIVSMLCYIDSSGVPVATSQGNTLVQWVGVPGTVGQSHHVNCNGWDSDGGVYPSVFVDFTRTS